MGPISTPNIASVYSRQMPALLAGQLPVIETHDTEIASPFVRSTVWVTLIAVGKKNAEAKNTSRGMSEHTCRDSGPDRKKATACHLTVKGATAQL